MVKTKTLVLIVVSVVVALTFMSRIDVLASFLYQHIPKRSDQTFVHPLKTVIPFSLPIPHQAPSSLHLNYSLSVFFKTNLVEHPEEANKLSPLLTTRLGVIEEAQRIHMNIFKRLLGRFEYAMLFNFSPSENKGDSAITVGEVIFLRKLGIKVIFACAIGTCTDRIVEKAQNMSKTYSNESVVILFHGGGNVIGWPDSDRRRAFLIKHFMDFQIVMFPQSIYYSGPQRHIDFCKKLYASHTNLTFVWRDRTSYDLGKLLFPKVKSLLSPDMAYQIGAVPRYMSPTQDIMWIKRTDKESPQYETPEQPLGYRMNVSDWREWKTPKGDSYMEDAFLRTANGMTYLQRGRIVITDRLHGHILSTLLGIPHVYIDNAERKISNYHNTWTAGVENIVLANSSADALIQAKHLLTKLERDLPLISGFYTNIG